MITDVIPGAVSPETLYDLYAILCAVVPTQVLPSGRDAGEIYLEVKNAAKIACPEKFDPPPPPESGATNG